MTSATILVVDDDWVILDLLAINFELEGYRVLRATDGESALASVEIERPDIVVTDIMMPNMSGLELMTRLKSGAATAGMPVVLLSAKALASDVALGLEAGADDYVTKPFEPDDLLERVRRLL